MPDERSTEYCPLLHISVLVLDSSACVGNISPRVMGKMAMSLRKMKPINARRFDVWMQRYRECVEVLEKYSSTLR